MLGRVSTPSVLISGASIAGPATASWLARAGYEVTVVERFAALRDDGQNIDVRGAAREVLRRMGLEEAALAAGTGEQGTVFLGEGGRELARFPASTDDTSGPTAEMEILRGRLGELLHDHSRDDVRYLFDDQIAGLAQDPDGVDVTFASGREQRVDLVVLAEGVNSRSRDLVFPTRVRQHLGMVVAYLTIPRQADDTDWWRWYVAGRGRGVNLRPDDVGTIRASLNVLTGTRGLDDLPRDAQVAALRRAFAGAGWQTDRVLDALDDAPLYVEDLAQVHLPSWSTGRVALVGDAAWCATPVSGIGTTLALAGAYTLAAALAGHDDHRVALAEYERRMRPFVEQGQSLPPGTPRIANPRTELGRRVFGAVLRVAASPLAARVGGVAGRFTTPPADRYELPAWPAA